MFQFEFINQLLAIFYFFGSIQNDQYKYYVEEKPLIRISEEIDRSYNYTRQLKSKALEAFGKQHDKFLKRKKVITNEC